MTDPKNADISRNTGEILIVDDNPKNLHLLQSMLAGQGYLVRAAKNGRLALQSVSHKVPDLILLDIRMPEMDGYEVCQNLKVAPDTKDVPVIFISALEDQEDKVRAFQVGGVDYISKPFRQEEVLARIKTHMSLSLAKKSLEKQNLNLQKEIDERKQVEKQLKKSHDKLNQTLADLKKTQAQMLRSEKLASIGQLAAGIAHEINNPTAFIASNLETLAGYQEDLNRFIEQSRKLTMISKEINAEKKIPAAVNELVETLKSFGDEIDIDFIKEYMSDIVKESLEGTERIKNIVIALKDFAQPGEGMLEDADIHQVLESTLEIVRNELKYKADIIKEYGDLPLVKSYPRQLGRIFINILVNAVQAIEEHGEIRISTKANHEDGYVEIRIADTGMGIPEENLSKIFDPFFTTWDVGKGTGLGLSMVHGIVERLNGQVVVDSKLNCGTSVTIYLPLILSEESGNEKKESSSIPKGKEHILAVDDEPYVTRLISSLLTPLGYRVTVKNSATEALELFCKTPEQYDLLLTDLTMPDLSGLELSQKILALRKDIPIILCTGDSHRIKAQEIEAMGISDVLKKPLTMKSLVHELRRVLDEETEH